MNIRALAQHEAYLSVQTETASSQNLDDIENDKATRSPSRKRAHADDIVNSQLSQKKGERERHAYRLQGDFNIPKDAQVITLPRPVDGDREVQLAGPAMSAKAGSGRPFKPLNTLQQQPHTAKSSHMVGNAIKNHQLLAQSTLRVQLCRGDNVPNGAAFIGDGFLEEPKQDTKRRKLQDGTPMSLRSDPIDLTSEEGSPNSFFGGELVGVNGRELSKSKRSHKLTAEGPFTNQELKEIDRRTATESGKKPRRRKDGQRSSQDSAQETADHSAGRSVNTVPRDPSPMVVVYSGRDKIEIRDEATQSARRSITQSSSINAGAGMQRRFNPRKHRSSDDDIESSNGILASGTRTRLSAEQMEHRRLLASGEEPRTRICQRDGTSISYIAPEPSAQPHEAPLRSTFRRDNREPSSDARARASKRMKASSDTIQARVSPIGAKSGSEDELAGASTVGSRASRSVSPQKQHTLAFENSRAGMSVRRSRSPGELRQSPVHTPGHSIPQQRSRGERTVGSAASDDVVQIPLRCLYSRSCHLSNGHIELRWDEEAKSFLIAHDGVEVKNSQKSQLVCIGSNEAHQWIQASQATMLAVQIKGSTTENSNGNIVIEFASKAGMSKAFRYLQWATKDSLRVSSHDEDKMRKIIKTQMPLISEDYHKRSNKDMRAIEMQAMQNRKDRRGRRGLPENDKIIYEYEETNGRSSTMSRRQSMHPSVYTDQLQLHEATTTHDTTSKYFSDGTRRSSRQSKPVKPRSPTPPPPMRWTRENDVERWSHSVVYPPKGARRVTVDFQDLERLDEGEFLNDNVISFALRQIEENMSPEHRHEVHFFNSFFYTALTTKNGKKGFNYDAVKRWTKSIDIFNYRYIVVPINIDLHWFVAIICNLRNMSRKPEHDDEDASDPALVEEKLSVVHNDDLTVAHPTEQNDENVTKHTTESMERLSLSDQDRNSDIYDFGGDGKVKANEELADMHNTSTMATHQQSSGSGRRSKKRPAPAPKKYDPDAPTIVHLDSFGGGHSAESRNLKEYLGVEASEKRSISVDVKALQGMTAKGVPEQTNFCDCGVYLVGYIEEFAKDPEKFITKVLRREIDRQRDFENFDASAKRAEIREALLKLHEVQDAERKASKASKVAKSTKIATSNAVTQPQVETIAGPTVLNTKEVHVPNIETLQGASAQRQTAVHEVVTPATTATAQDHDELETEVPRPLAEAIPQAAPVVRQRSEGVEEEDEMLDDMNTNEADSIQLISKNSQNITTGVRDQLLKELQAGSNTAENQPMTTLDDTT